MSEATANLDPAGSDTALLNPRLSALRDEAVARKGAWVTAPNPFERDVALWRARRDRPLLSVAQQRARTLLELVDLAKIEIRPGWRLAGEHLSGHAFGLLSNDPSLDRARMAEFGLTVEQQAEVQACVTRFTAPPDRYYAIGEHLHDMPAPQGVFWSWGWIENHSIRDYAKVLRIGFDGIRAEVEARLAATPPDHSDYARSEAFWKAVLWVCDAGCLLGKRYADLADELALHASSDEERERLKAMAERCRRVPAEGARTFAEAVQALWLAHVLTCGEDSINANSIGRLDQILYPYYAADIAAGGITRAEALEWMEELALKLYLDYDVQAITLGGLDRNGHNATNDLTALVLEATRNVGFVRDVSVRLNAQTPPEVLEQCVELVVRGGGIPFFFNDDCFIPALVERGIPIEDARDYAPIGCIELTIPGRANPHAVSGWFNSTKCLELALFDGLDPASGEQLGPHTGALTDFQTFEALYAAYATQVRHFAQQLVYHCNRGELAQREAGPLPCWSALTDDCIARGRD